MHLLSPLAPARDSTSPLNSHHSSKGNSTHSFRMRVLKSRCLQARWLHV